MKLSIESDVGSNTMHYRIMAVTKLLQRFGDGAALLVASLGYQDILQNEWYMHILHT